MTQSQISELARRESRAQHGIIEFAEELQAIRDGNMYPGAKSEPDAWKSYCKERWGMSGRSVDDGIRALPVLKRLATLPAGERETPSVSAAASVATLPEPVQDAILSESPKRNDASDKAKAVRKEAKRIVEQEGREPTDDELVAVAQAQPKPQKKPKRKAKRSKFASAMEMAHFEIERAADLAVNTVLDDTENDFGWNRVEKIEYQLARVKDRLYRPEWRRDTDEDFAELLAGEES